MHIHGQYLLTILATVHIEILPGEFFLFCVKDSIEDMVTFNYCIGEKLHVFHQIYLQYKGSLGFSENFHIYSILHLLQPCNFLDNVL